MLCVICRFGHTEPGFVTVKAERDEVPFVMHNVPATICDSCGEYYLSSETSHLVDGAAEKVFRQSEFAVIASSRTQ